MNNTRKPSPTDKKPREFWIEIGNECDDIVWHKSVNERTIHVIEFEAYAQLQQEVQELKHRNSAIYQAGHYLGLEAQVAMQAAVANDLVEALCKERDDYRAALEDINNAHEGHWVEEILAKYSKEESK